VRVRVAFALLLGLSATARAESVAGSAPADPLLQAASAELDRIWAQLSAAPEPAYWMSLGVTDRRSVEVQATHGAAGSISRSHTRAGDVDVRVGSPELDNSHKIRDAGWFSEDPRVTLDLPLVDAVPRATRYAIWRAFDDTYRTAVRRLVKVRTNDAVKVEREDQSADFSLWAAVRDEGPVAPLVVDAEAWRDAARRASAVFLNYPGVYDSNVNFQGDDEVQYILTTEGTRIRQQRHHLRMSLWAGTVAEDGMELQVYDYIDAASPDGLPDVARIIDMAHAAARQVEALRVAPVVDPYVGPAILRGRAAAVFFHEILGHRVEGHRQKDEDEGQTLTDKVGKPIFPDFITVVDDPTVARVGAVDLNGHYRYDDEGVPAERVSIVDKGVLKGFLMSRAPIEGFARSNGHGRRQPGSAVVARQGNLLVSTSAAVPYTELRARLLQQIKAQGRPYGFVFDDITGGFTFTGRSNPNSYAVQPVTVWRIWADGRPDELVRGVDLIGTPLTTFQSVMAASDRVDVFNGVCGAESGWVPVSAVSPDLLVREVEVQRKDKANDRPPLLPPPVPVPANGGGR
jgi:TldD protein